MIDSLETLPFSPTSHSTGSAFKRLVGAPPVVGHHRDPVVAGHDLLHAAHALIFDSS